MTSTASNDSETMGCFPSKKKATEEEPVAPPAEPPFLPYDLQLTRFHGREDH